MKKLLKVVGLILVILIILGIIFFIIDYSRVKNNETPLFCILKDEANDGGTKIYLGLGYKVIDFHTLAEYDDIKIGSWFMDYNDFEEEMKEYEERFEKEMKNSEYSFCGTITQVEENLFFVEPDENEEIKKSADLIMVEKLKIDTNVKYEIGERVKITYDGNVMTTYPAQINAVKYERISEEQIDINTIYKGDIKVMNKEKLKVKIFLILSLVFAILTLISGYLVITHKLDNAGYSVIPMLFTLTFSILYRNSKKDEE